MAKTLVTWMWPLASSCSEPPDTWSGTLGPNPIPWDLVPSKGVSRKWKAWARQREDGSRLRGLQAFCVSLPGLRETGPQRCQLGSHPAVGLLSEGGGWGELWRVKTPLAAVHLGTSDWMIAGRQRGPRGLA